MKANKKIGNKTSPVYKNNTPKGTKDQRYTEEDAIKQMFYLRYKYNM